VTRVLDSRGLIADDHFWSSAINPFSPSPEPIHEFARGAVLRYRHYR
jgi:hypothetical protein